MCHEIKKKQVMQCEVDKNNFITSMSILSKKEDGLNVVEERFRKFKTNHGTLFQMY